MTTTNDKWTEQEAGIDCHLCQPHLSAHPGLIFIAHLSASSLYLALDQRFRGHSSLILSDHEARLEVLPERAYAAYMEDLRLSAGAKTRLCKK